MSKRIESVIRNSFHRYGGCTLGHAMIHGSSPDHIICFRKDRDRRSILVLVWPPGSQAKFWVGSHKLDLPVKRGPEYHLHFSREHLENAACVEEQIFFPDGGL